MSLPPIQVLLSKLSQTNPFPIPIVVPIKPKSSEKSADKNADGSYKPPVKSKFTPYEDMMLTNIILNAKCTNWFEVANLMKTRNARQCRDRWNNYLNPYLRSDPWTEEEDKLLIEKYKIYGTKWRKISAFFRNRSDNSLRNRYQILERKMNRQTFTSPSNSSSSSEQ